ncbi:hypothetical protein B0T17DRAFT_525698 [Bombardia bombarda]|uniref:Uncharacterized protein n=1 Tax=Bombardia bombarda TaxID=252184 RepID=A0AA39XA54_9PEZI|nr:hypothetical protein B0T17DRAFT_525698 [Bombardia bombarda]
MGVLMDKIERLSQQIQSLEQKGHDPRLGTDKEWVKSLTLSSRTQIDSHTALITKESKEPGLGGVLEDLNRTMQTINLTMAQIRSQDYRRYIDSKPRHDTAEFLGPEPRTRRSRRSTIGYREGGELDWEELQYSNKPPGVRRQVRASGPVSAFHDSEEEEGEQSVEQDYEEPTPSWEPIKTRQTQRQSEGTGAKGRRLAPLSTGGVKRAAAPNATSEARWRGGGRVQDGFETRNVDEQESDASNDSENMVAERSRREYRNAHRYRNSRERLNDTPPVPDAPRRAAKTGGVGKRGGRGQE